jgi:enoyl-CoA hydratase
MKWVHVAHDLVHALRGSPKPILAAIDGTAVGGGLEITYHADLRFASADARLGQPEINLAFIPPIAGTQALVRLIGHGRAFRMLTEGALITAQEAHEIGLVDTIWPAETLIDEVQAYAETLAEKPANALAAIRKCLIEGGDHRFADGMTLELAEVNELMSHPNFAEGVAAFLDRRIPDWA